jgi:hypothetical protein
MRVLIASTALAASTLVVPLTTSAPAHANPCNPGSWTTMHLNKVYVQRRDNGDNSYYNKTQDPSTETLTFGYQKTYQVEHHWETGGSAGISWSIVSANVEAKYGKSYTSSSTVHKDDSKTFTIRSHYTGWTRAIVYRHPVVWKRLKDHWTGSRCETRTIAKAIWAPPRHQLVAITKKGHRYPA